VNKKSDMSLKILESLHGSKAQLEHYDAIVQKLVILLDKVAILLIKSIFFYKQNNNILKKKPELL
jgi:hypothetical protein